LQICRYNKRNLLPKLLHVQTRAGGILFTPAARLLSKLKQLTLALPQG